MDLNRINRSSKGAVVTYFIRLILGLVIFALFISIYAKLVAQTGELWNDIDETLIMVAAIFLGGFMIVSIIHLIYYILIIVDSYSFREDQLPFVLLIVGLFFRLIGIVGIFLLRSRVKSAIGDENNEEVYDN